jgi:predicted alpha/beta-fold hydrolase
MIDDAVSVLPAFKPKRWLSNGHAMTLYAWGRARDFSALPEPEPCRIRVDADAEVLAHCYWQPAREGRPTLLALHGLESSTTSHYMRGLAERAWRRGWNAVLLNQRNCGGTEALSPRLYHSGLTADPREVVRTLAARHRLDAVGIVGYSLGGNLALKLAGELQETPDLPVRAVVGVSPTIDLARCVRAIERKINYPYQWNFVRQLRARMRRMAAAWPGAFDLTPLDRIWSIRRFDEIYTAPHHGFRNALDYYTRASALRVTGRIRVPALVLSAADDPVVPPGQFDDASVRDNPNIRVHVTAHGGHCGFIAEDGAGSEAYWAEDAAVSFLAGVMGDPGLSEGRVFRPGPIPGSKDPGLR